MYDDYKVMCYSNCKDIFIHSHTLSYRCTNQSISYHLNNLFISL